MTTTGRSTAGHGKECATSSLMGTSQAPDGTAREGRMHRERSGDRVGCPCAKASSEAARAKSSLTSSRGCDRMTMGYGPTIISRAPPTTTSESTPTRRDADPTHGLDPAQGRGRRVQHRVHSDVQVTLGLGGRRHQRRDDHPAVKAADVSNAVSRLRRIHPYVARILPEGEKREKSPPMIRLDTALAGRSRS